MTKPNLYVKLNKKTKKGFILSGYYLQYKKEGGLMSPIEWNQRVRELNEKK